MMKLLRAFVAVVCCAFLQVAPLQAAAPQIALNAMPQGAISLKWQALPRAANRQTIALHIFCLPKGHSKERAQMFDEIKTGPVKRADINTGLSINPSPFWFDVWTAAGAPTTWRRLNRVAFTQTKDVQEIVLRWLDPATRSTPFVALHFGFTHWHEWETFTFANGWTATPHQRTFLRGGEGGSGVWQQFDQARGGRMVIVETEYEQDLSDVNDKVKTTQFVYRWNGREWLDATQKYFLIAATFRTSREAQAWRNKYWGEVVRSSDYPKLRAGYFVVVLDRFRSLREASERAKLVKADGRNRAFKLYVRRAL